MQQLTASRSGLAPLKVQRPFQQARRPLSVAVRAQVRPSREGVVRACSCGHTGGSAGPPDCLDGSSEHFGRPGPPLGSHPPCRSHRSSLLPQRPEQQQPANLSATFGSLAAVLGLLSGAASPALAADFAPPPTNTTTLEQQQTREFPGDAPLASAPSVFAGSDYQLPEGTQWRYSEFINAVKVRRRAVGLFQCGSSTTRPLPCLPLPLRTDTPLPHPFCLSDTQMRVE